MVSFAVQNLFSLVRSRLFIFALLLSPEEIDPKKYFQDQCQRVYCLCFCLRVLWFQVLTFESFFFFVYGVLMSWKVLLVPN